MKGFPKKLTWKRVAITAGIILICTAAGSYKAKVSADGLGYEYIEQTEDEAVIALTEQVAEKYPICPELIQALIFYESSNRLTLVSKWGDVGYMQVNPKWHTERMDKLGVTDLTDGYGNILVGTDYLYELCVEYEDVAVALMVYNQGPEAAEKAEAGEISSYARKILDLSAKLERLHGK